MAYGRQFRGVRQDNRLRPDYAAALNAQLQYLPERIAQQRAEAEHQDLVSYQNRSLQQSENQFMASQELKKKQMAQTEAEQRSAMGVEAAKTGLGMSMKGGANLSDRLGGTVPSMKVGSINPADRGYGGFAGGSPTSMSKPQGLFSSIGNKISSTLSPLKESASKYLGHLNLGNTIGAGLMGFGASRLFGGNNKLKKFGIGAAAGGLMSLFTGSGGGGAKDAITGSLFGGLGGLFS